MKTAQQHLQDYQVTMEEAYAFVTANLTSPKAIFEVAKQYGVTNAMLAEIVQPKFPGVTAAEVQQFFGDNGFNPKLLDSLVFEGHSYYFVEQPMTSLVAQSYAYSMGGNLAMINSAAENAFVFENASAMFANYIAKQTKLDTLVANDGGSGAYIWLGGYDIVQEGSWQWADGSSIPLKSTATSYANWGTNAALNFSEPDNFNNDQDALAMGLSAWPNPVYNAVFALGVAGQWNDINQNNLLPFVIEFA